jgi:hypothetical protein
MTSPVDPVQRPRVEPTAPTRRVVRGREQPHEQPDPRRRQRDDEAGEGEEDGGLHVDVLA